MAPRETPSTTAPVPGEATLQGHTNTVFRVAYPTYRDHLFKNPELWIEGRRIDDDVGRLWRIHNKLYDLTNFLDRHPGGKFWLETTRGMDITEAFESAHLNPSVAKLLPKYYVKEARGPRNSPYTFHEDGFYRTLKRKAWPIISSVGSGPTLQMVALQDCAVIVFLILMATAAHTHSYLTAGAAGIALTMVMTMAHNFFHQADNFRMYYFDLSLFDSAGWRISHAISHHLYTNTLNDFEVSSLEPFLSVLPEPKTKFQKYTTPVTLHLLMLFGFVIETVKRLVFMALGKTTLRWANLLPLVEALAMMALAGQVAEGFSLWVTMMCSCSFSFLYMGLTAAHHHPDIYHAHDTFRKKPDWGLCQLDAVRDKVEVTGSLFLVSISFGDHTLHHLFPTVDHSKLPFLYPVFLETCRQFGVPYTFVRQSYLCAGLYKQIMATTPNRQPPGYTATGAKVPLPRSVVEQIEKQKQHKSS